MNQIFSFRCHFKIGMRLNIKSKGTEKTNFSPKNPLRTLISDQENNALDHYFSDIFYMRARKSVLVANPVPGKYDIRLKVMQYMNQAYCQ